MEEKRKLICAKCQIEMEDIEIEFDYLSRTFRHKVPRCPECGQVFISEKLAIGRIKDVEKSLEEK